MVIVCSSDEELGNNYDLRIAQKTMVTIAKIKTDSFD